MIIEIIMLTIAIQYPSFGVQHPPRLKAIAKASPYQARIVAMEMFRKDSDYEWNTISCSSSLFDRYTVMDCDSETGRKTRWALKTAVVKALEDIQPDVLIVNGWGHRESRISLQWGRKHHCPMVLLSDSVYENMRRYWWKEACKRWIIKGCLSAFVAGTPQARYANYLGIPGDKIFHPGSCVVDNNYWQRECKNIRKQDSIRHEIGLPEKYFLCVARFIALKNIPFLLSAYAKYRETAGEKSFALVLCGSGPEETNIRSTIGKLNLLNVYLPGFQQANTLTIYYSLASCFILPSSHFECWGLVVNEAMASGLPVLVSKMCGCAEDLVKEGQNGYSFSPVDELSLANLMLQITQDEKKLAAMGRESRCIIAEHSCKVGAVNLWKAITAAMATKNSGA